LEEAYLSGKKYEFTTDDGSNENVAQDFLNHFRSKVYLTYRKHFPSLSDTMWTTDAGWGCMLRSMQMLLADALIVHYLRPDWRYSPSKRRHPNYAQILRSFCDYPDCMFSIHSLLSQNSSKKAGTWFGPGECAYMVQKCVHSSLNGLKVVLASDGVLYSEDVESVITQENSYVLILIPVRLGLDFIPPTHYSSILDCLKMQNSVGIAGGKPKRSLFFPGFQGNRLFYLDPHKCQATVHPSHDFCRNSSCWHSNIVHSIEVSELDPSMCFGFYCTWGEWPSLKKCFVDHTNRKHPAFSFLKNRMHFDDVSVEETM